MNPNEIAELPPVRRNTIAEMRQVLDAIEQGKPIQWYNATKDKWDDTTNKRPNFCDSTYRIKPEEPKKRLRSFNDTAELFVHNNGSNILWLKNKDTGWLMMVTLYNEREIAFSNDAEFTMEEVLNEFTFADGTPCGVEEDA